MNRIKIWIQTVFYYIGSFNCVKRSRLLTPTETIEEFIKTRKTIIRYGDGEFILIGGKGIHYQAYNEEISHRLNEIVENYINNSMEKEYILCMPNQYLSMNGLQLSKKRLWISCWSKTRFIFKKNFDNTVVYGDSFIFGRGNEDLYKRIWEDYEDIVFVHNSEKYAIDFKHRYKKNVYFIKAPANNAFKEYERILIQIKIQCNQVNNPLVILSCGPCAKLLAYDLCKSNIISVDTGHCWDEPLEIIDA